LGEATTTIADPDGIIYLKRMTKEEKIKEAWADVVGLINVDQIRFDENGYSDFKCKKLIPAHSWDRLLESRLKQSKSKLESDKIVYRPKGLKGLEKNNGWIKIESDKDLPTDKIPCYRMYVEGLKKAFNGFWDGCWCYYPDGKTGGIYELKGVSHYKILTEEPKPIY